MLDSKNDDGVASISVKWFDRGNNWHAISVVVWHSPVGHPLQLTARIVVHRQKKSKNFQWGSGVHENLNMHLFWGIKVDGKFAELSQKEKGIIHSGVHCYGQTWGFKRDNIDMEGVNSMTVTWGDERGVHEEMLNDPVERRCKVFLNVLSSKHTDKLCLQQPLKKTTNINYEGPNVAIQAP
jgi:hypothetical protein